MSKRDRKPGVGIGLVLGGMGLFAILMLVLLLFGLGRWLQPDPPAPDLVGRQPEAVVTHISSDDEPEPDLVIEDAAPAFDPSDLCPVEVLLEPDDGAQLDDARVRATMSYHSDWSGLFVDSELVEPNRYQLEGLPCGLFNLRVNAEGYVAVRREDVDSISNKQVVVPLIQGVFLRGIVTDTEGEPIEGARVKAGHEADYTDVDGAYELQVDPAELWRVWASADGYLSDSQRLRLPPDTIEDAELDFELVASREVTVYCAGLPEDSCDSVLPIMCTYTLLPWGSFCTGDPVRCACPEGTVAIRGGGQTVEVPPNEYEAWLDFRSSGSIIGRVVNGDEPVDCEVMAAWSPQSLMDFADGFMNIRKGRTDEDGHFVLAGLVPGAWSLNIMGEAGDRATRYETVIEGQVTDAGTIDLTAGGVIRGVVIDALTEQGAPGEGVAAIRADLGTELPSMGMAYSGPEGAFEIGGLEDGDYKVYTVMRPMTQEDVTISDGEANRELELTTGAADLLAENGFGLVTDEYGELEVDQVTDGGPADRAGLRGGDVIDGILVGGVDIGAFFPALDEMLVEAMLEHYPGPGISLIVDRDGQELTIPLE